MTAATNKPWPGSKETGEPEIDALTFTVIDIAQIASMLDTDLDERMARQLFLRWMKEVKSRHQYIDICWAAAQVVANLLQRVSADDRTDALRGIMTMVLLASQGMHGPNVQRFADGQPIHGGTETKQ